MEDGEDVVTLLFQHKNRCREDEERGREGVHGSDRHHALQFGLRFGVKESKREGGKGEAGRRDGRANSTVLAKSADAVVGCPLLLLDQEQPPTPSAMPIALSLIK